VIDWTRFRRRNLSKEMRCSDPGVAVVGCGDDAQALAWLVRTDATGRDGTMEARTDASAVTLTVPGLADGTYTVTAFDTKTGISQPLPTATADDGILRVVIGPVRTDVAVAIRR